MGDIKPWQIILLVVAFGVLGASVWKFGFSNTVRQPSGILLVDVQTGVLYDTRKGKNRGILLPAPHPETQEPTLFPVEKTEDGGWYIRSRYRTLLEEMRVERDAVDRNYKVSVTDENPIRYVVPVPEE